jgi:hypothetical protein
VRQGELIKTAGLGTPARGLSPAAPSARRAAIQLVRQALRKQDATDDEVDDALEALIELAKD